MYFVFLFRQKTSYEMRISDWSSDVCSSDLLVEPLSLDEAYLDVSENKRGLASATEVAQQIRREIREQLQLPPSAGVAPNKFVSKLASGWKKPDGLVVVRPRDGPDFLAPHPAARLPCLGKVMADTLPTMGPR